MTLLAYIEQNGSQITKGARALIRAALETKVSHGYAKVTGVLLGGGDTAAAAQDAARYGLDEIVFAKSDSLAQYLAQPYEEAFRALERELTPKLVMALSSSRGKDLLPRVAQFMSAGQASDCIAILPGGRFRRPMYAGNVLAEVEITTERKVVTVRSTAFEPAMPTAAASPVREISLPATSSGGMKFVNFETVKSERPELTDAEIVVSGGRALKSKENFEQLIAPLADAFGAAIGASRAAVDSGYAPNDWQVGQTGKVVAPKLYIAVGISGAIQHLAGMKDSKVIVAVNKDAEAPIFEVADYGLIGDLFQVVPELIAAVKKARG